MFDVPSSSPRPSVSQQQHQPQHYNNQRHDPNSHFQHRSVVHRIRKRYRAVRILRHTISSPISLLHHGRSRRPRRRSPRNLRLRNTDPPPPPPPPPPNPPHPNPIPRPQKKK